MVVRKSTLAGPVLSKKLKVRASSKARQPCDKWDSDLDVESVFSESFGYKTDFQKSIVVVDGLLK